MSEDNTQAISEETLASIADAAQNIAEESDAMRQNIVAIAEALQPTIQQAGIEFEASGMWDDNDAIKAERYYYRLVTVDRHRWGIVIEEDFSRCPDVNVDEVRVQGGTRFIGFDKASRSLLAEAVVMLPIFISEYAAELKRRHIKYADLRKKAEQIRAIVEG